jgi:general stress protein YciG
MADKKSQRGFASMEGGKQREIAKKGGESVPGEKRSFSQDRELAAEAGRKGGQNVLPGDRSFSRDPGLAAEAGRQGGRASGTRQQQEQGDAPQSGEELQYDSGPRPDERPAGLAPGQETGPMEDDRAKRGFAAMDEDQRRSIASKGGKESGGNFRNAPQRAAEAGKKGGQQSASPKGRRTGR